MGRATIEAVLRMSAEAVAGAKEQDRRDADRELYRHGVQSGRAALQERQLRVEKPRLHKSVRGPARLLCHSSGLVFTRLFSMSLTSGAIPRPRCMASSPFPLSRSSA